MRRRVSHQYCTTCWIARCAYLRWLRLPTHRGGPANKRRNPCSARIYSARYTSSYNTGRHRGDRLLTRCFFNGSGRIAVKAMTATSNVSRKNSVMLKTTNWLSCALLGACLAAPAWAHPDAAHVQAENAWARASVQGQQATGAFMQLTAKEPLRLVGVETPVAASGEIHEMKMEGDVMRMRQIDSLDLPQGVAVQLKPGGYHLMFQQLKAPLQAGTQVPVTLVFQDAKDEISRLHLQVPVQRMAPEMGQGAPMSHSHGH